MLPSDISGPSAGSSFAIDPEESNPSPAEHEASSAVKSPYGYAGEPPIREVSPQELGAVAEEFRSSIGSYANDDKGQPVSAEHSGDPHAAERWNNQSVMAQGLAEDIGGAGEDADLNEGNAATNGESKAFSYDLGDHSVAMMTLRHTTPSTTVDALAAHPATQGAGKTMMEKAVNESQAAGNQGRVKLSSLDDSSDGFYQSIGFNHSETQSGYMELDPSQSKLWSQGNDGKWQLTHTQKPPKEGEDDWQLKKEPEFKGFLRANEGAKPAQASSSKRPREEEREDEEARPEKLTRKE
jgi:hypothetical protein